MDSNRFLSLVCWITVIASLLGCQRNDDFQWKEEVLLPTAISTIVLTRNISFDMRGRADVESFEFLDPTQGKEINWSGAGVYKLIALDMLNGSPFIVVGPRYVNEVNDLGCPNPAQVLFRYDGLNWVEVKYSESPIQKLGNNVFAYPLNDRESIERQKQVIKIDKKNYVFFGSDKKYWELNLQDRPTRTLGCASQAKRVLLN